MNTMGSGYQIIPVSIFLLASSLFSSVTVRSDQSFKNKKEITVVITDSGLGGLAVMDDIAKEMSRSGYYKTVNLIFVNALFDPDKGYNALIDRDQKIDVFNDVLYGISDLIHPDIILIGCNTLSVIYRETPFVKESRIPVYGIVESGVQLIEGSMSEDKRSLTIITGTETTISEDTHRKALLESGISDSRIITQSCPQLQSYIEKDPDGEDTEMLISFYIEEAISKLPADHGKVYLSLNCSHFGYSEPLWKNAFRISGTELAGILDPNTVMGDILLPENPGNRSFRTKLTMRVVSKVEIRNKESMYNFFHDSSPELAKALNNYDIVQDLF
jgi:glutamate racemase